MTECDCSLCCPIPETLAGLVDHARWLRACAVSADRFDAEEARRVRARATRVEMVVAYAMDAS